MTRRYIMVLLLLAGLPALAAAQSPAYYGGSGDGYAEAELNGVNLSVSEGAGQEVFLSLYPNPAPQGGNLWLKADISAPLEVQIHDMTGKLVHSQVIQPGNSAAPISPPGLAGVYFISFTSQGWQSTQKLIFN